MVEVSDLKDALSAVSKPVHEARGLPNAVYADPHTFALETRAIFHSGWACVGVGASVPNPGDAMPIDFLGAPLLLVRDHDGALRLFQNVCRHRGMVLVQEKKNFRGVIRCPYHSWCYSLKGDLKATPHVGGPGTNNHAAIDPETTGLLEVRMGVYLDAVFADISGQAEPFEDYIAPLRERWADFEGRPIHHGGDESRFKLDVDCNWKLAVENYCESYHLPWVHPGLNSYSRLQDHYNIERPRRFSGQGTLVYNPRLDPVRSFPNFEGLPSRWDTAAEYIALYPNVLFGVHRDHVYSIRLEPIGHNKTREHIELYYADAGAAQAQEWQDMRIKNAAMWKDIFIEDIFVVEGMQRGRGAPGFDGGVFSPVMDAPTHCFHDWVADRLAS